MDTAQKVLFGLLVWYTVIPLAVVELVARSGRLDSRGT